MIPEVSIIVPVYNRASIISTTINSVIAQTFSNWELILVDDGSNDGIYEVIQKFIDTDPRIFFHKRQEGVIKGANTCRNIGFQLAKGKYIKWLDSDDILEPEALEIQLSKIVNANADVCFCQTGYFFEKENKLETLPKKWSKRIISEDPINDYLFAVLRWNVGGVLWRKGFLDEKPFLVGLRNSQEWLMHLKFLLKKPIIIGSDDIVCKARVHEDSMSNRKNKNGRYYFHECMARIEAMHLIRKYSDFPKKGSKKLLKTFFWYSLFMFFKKGGFKYIFRIIPAYYKAFSFYFVYLFKS